MTSDQPPQIPDFAAMRATEIDAWFKDASTEDIEAALAARDLERRP